LRVRDDFRASGGRRRKEWHPGAVSYDVEVERPESIVVGTASVNWGFDPYYTWVTLPDFDRLLDEMRAAGYAGTEISYHFPADAAALRADLARRDLRAAATFHWVDVRDDAAHDAALASIVPVADRLTALGSDTVIVADAPTPARLAVGGRVAADGSDGLSDAQWASVGRGLDKIGARLRERGMRTVFHPHVGTFVETRAEIDRLCAETDPGLVGLCPDTGHLAYAGVDPAALFADYAARIGYVHLKDVDPAVLARVRAERIGFVEGVELGMFPLLGRGMVDIAAIVAALRRADYAGWLIVEQDAPREPLAAATQNRAYLRDTFGV
jgi:inosose dehydratase